MKESVRGVRPSLPSVVTGSFVFSLLGISLSFPGSLPLMFWVLASSANILEGEAFHLFDSCGLWRAVLPLEVCETFARSVKESVVSWRLNAEEEEVSLSGFFATWGSLGKFLKKPP